MHKKVRKQKVNNWLLLFKDISGHVQVTQCYFKHCALCVDWTWLWDEQCVWVCDSHLYLVSSLSHINVDLHVCLCVCALITMNAFSAVCCWNRQLAAECNDSACVCVRACVCRVCVCVCHCVCVCFHAHTHTHTLTNTLLMEYPDEVTVLQFPLSPL